jgi:anti-anti-sigma regulatory factor
MAGRRVPVPHSRPRSGAAPAGENLSAVVDTDGRITVIHLAGSLRCATAQTLREAVDAALDERPATVVLDLADASADDELGLWLLPAMAGDAGRQGIDLVIAAPARALRVRLRRLGGRHLEITDRVPVIAAGSPLHDATGPEVPTRPRVRRDGGRPSSPG